MGLILTTGGELDFHGGELDFHGGELDFHGGELDFHVILRLLYSD